MTLEYKKKDTKKIFFLILGLAFVVFIFTSDGHRYAIDEHHGSEMALHMTTLEPDPAYIDGESKFFFDNPIYNPRNIGPICSNGITCYPASVFYSAMQVPFVAANHYLHIISPDTLVLTVDDFVDPHYIIWRNSQNVDLVFMELFFGPTFSAMSVAIFFLICLEQKFTRNNSIILTFLLAFSTMIWAYSNTSLNLVPTLFFVLLGYLFLKKYQRLHQNRFLIFSSAVLGFGFLIRPDVVLFIIPIWIFLLVSRLSTKKKILSKILSKMFHLTLFSIPSIICYYIFKIIPNFRYNLSSEKVGLKLTNEEDFRCLNVADAHIRKEFGDSCTPDNTSIFGDLASFTQIFVQGDLYSPLEVATRTFGILLSPGVGLFIFCPILLTIFFSFGDFFRKNKSDCLLILSFLMMNIIYHCLGTGGWHGLNAWGARYLLLMIPFLLIPLGASLEQRDKRKIISILIILGIIGAFFNTVYVIQDVSWFVWSRPGTDVGLFALEGFKTANLYLVPEVIWTFQFSQLTHSIIQAFESLQHDIYLLHVFGGLLYSMIFTFSISILSYLFYRVIRSKKISEISEES